MIGCRTLFATHYHELTQLSQSLPHAANWNVAVRESAERVTFLHKIVPGSADKSYGIHVAQLAGVPVVVLDRARVILQTLEDDHVDEAGETKIPARSTAKKSSRQLSLFELPPHAALQELHRLQQQLKN